LGREAIEEGLVWFVRVEGGVFLPDLGLRLLDEGEAVFGVEGAVTVVAGGGAPDPAAFGEFAEDVGLEGGFGCAGGPARAWASLAGAGRRPLRAPLLPVPAGALRAVRPS